MTEKQLTKEHVGCKFKVIHCKNAVESFYEALNSVEASKHRRFENAIVLQIERLANGDRMSQENFPQEGELPKLPGQSNAKKFNAFKRMPVRGYCWLSSKYSNTYFISHYVYKNYTKLKNSDVNIVHGNWRRIEVDGDEF